MSLSLAAMLNNLAVESGEVAADDLDHSFVGAEEITIVTDETQTELEEAVADAAEKVDKLEESDAAAEKVIDAVESIESNLRQLRAQAAAGQPLDRGAMQWFIQNTALACEARDLPVALFDKEVLGMQSSFEANQLEDYTQEAEEQSEGLLRRLYNVLKNAIIAAGQAIKEFFTTIGKTGTAIANGGSQLVRVGGTLKGAPKKATIKTSGYGLLMEGGSFNPKGAVDDVKTKFTSELTSKVIVKFGDSLQPLLSALKTPSAAAISSADTSASHVAAITFDLPGGHKAELKPGSGEGLAKIVDAKFTITGGDAKAPAEHAPLTPAEIVELGKALQAFGKEMSNSKVVTGALSKSNDALLNAADSAIKGSLAERIKDKVSDKNKEQRDGINAARELLAKAQKAVSAGRAIAPVYVKFMAKVGKEAYNFGRTSCSAYGTKEAAAAPAAKPDEAK